MRLTIATTALLALAGGSHGFVHPTSTTSMSTFAKCYREHGTAERSNSRCRSIPNMVRSGKIEVEASEPEPFRFPKRANPNFVPETWGRDNPKWTKPDLPSPAAASEAAGGEAPPEKKEVKEEGSGEHKWHGENYLEAMESATKSKGKKQAGSAELTEALWAAVDGAQEIESKQRQVKEKHQGRIPVRFINYNQMGGPGKLVYAIPGANVLKVADEAGIRIPRQCRSGLCGSCTCDVKDPTWEEEGQRVGYQTVRTCQAGAMLPAGCDEMVIDCYRMITSSQPDEEGMLIPAGSPMANFEEGWEKDFKPDYKQGGNVVVQKKTRPEWTVRKGQRSSVEVEKPHWTPKIDSNVAPWETVW